MDRILIKDWVVANPVTYLLSAAALSLAIRIISATLRSFERSERLKMIPLNFWEAFKGFHTDPLIGDRWMPFILGFLELLIYPFLIKAGLWVGIGAWITLKTVAQWESWQKHRNVFNRFLIGNALVIISAFVLLTPEVSVTLQP